MCRSFRGDSCGRGTTAQVPGHAFGQSTVELGIVECGQVYDKRHWLHPGGSLRCGRPANEAAWKVFRMSGKKLNDAGYGQVGKLIKPTHSLLPGENMQKSKCDKKGRLLLKPALRRRYGGEFFVVEMPREVVLLPVPRDPVKDLREWGRPLRHMSMEEIKRAIQEQAEKEVSMLGLR